MYRVFIGYDERESLAWHVCERSIERHAKVPVCVTALNIRGLRHSGLYRRHYTVDTDGQRLDTVDGRPVSTDFTYTRFLVPALMQYDGWALFCDSDFMFRADVSKLFAQADKRFAVQVVKRDFQPTERTKMRGQSQARYPRKNWSSLILWNCGHPANRALTPDYVNTVEGRQLHQFRWIDDEFIGTVSSGWNWLEGHDSLSVTPDAVHYTRGTPDMPGYGDSAYAHEWFAYSGHHGLGG